MKDIVESRRFQLMPSDKKPQRLGKSLESELD